MQGSTRTQFAVTPTSPVVQHIFVLRIFLAALSWLPQLVMRTIEENTNRQEKAEASSSFRRTQSFSRKTGTLARVPISIAPRVDAFQRLPNHVTSLFQLDVIATNGLYFPCLPLLFPTALDTPKLSLRNEAWKDKRLADFETASISSGIQKAIS